MSTCTDYADQMKALAQQYIPPDKDAIQDAFSKGNISITPGASGTGDVKIVIVNYVKHGDSMTLMFDKNQKQISSIKIASYLTDPSDAMNPSVQFSRLPDSTSHVPAATVDGVSQQVLVAAQNSDHQKI